MDYNFMVDRPIRAFLIDMDGTLLDTESIDYAATIAAVKSLGYPHIVDIYHALVGLATASWEPELLKRYGPRFPVKDFYGAYATEREALIQAGVNLKPGAIEFLDALKTSTLPLAIVTSSSRKTADRLLKLTGLHGYFDLISTRNDVEQSKPSPDLYLFAADKFSLSPRDCIAIEDSPVGVEAAFTAGVPVFMVPDIVQPSLATSAKCLAVLPSLADVLTRLRGLGVDC